MSKGKPINREHWLTEAARLVEPFFRGFTVSPYRVTCGWPSSNALGTRSRTIGQCHSHKSSRAGIHELFISPVLEDPLQVAGVLCHEMAHVVAGVEAAHGGKFVKVCRHVGLTKGKPTQVMPGEQLEGRLRQLLLPLGPYPHSAVIPAMREKVRKKGSHTLMCECGCRVTISQKWLDEAGPPTCGCGLRFSGLE